MNRQLLHKKKSVLFIYCCQPHVKNTIRLDIFLLSDGQCSTEHQLQYLLSRFPGVLILQLLIIYRNYDYDILTLSQ
jgi:hypothetical protein